MIESPIFEVLKMFQQHSETYISGGIIRDFLLGIPPKDVDLITTIPFDKIKELVPRLHVTDKGEKVQVGRFQKNSFTFEITSYSGSYKEFVSHKDFTINTFLHDGKSLIDVADAQQDIKDRIIKPMEDFLTHTIEHPQAYLRAIRIASKINGKIDTSLLYLMKEKKEIFYRNNENRIRQEGYEILHNPHPYIGWNILFELGFLDSTINLSKPIQFEPQDTPYLLAFLSLHSSIEAVEQFTKLFGFKESHLDEATYILNLTDANLSKLSPKQLSMAIKWNRYRFQHEPDKLQEFFIFLKEFYSKNK